jgi:hypothetical protein
MYDKKEFNLEELMRERGHELVEIVETDSFRVMYTGTIRQVASLVNLSDYQVLGYANWGNPAKRLKKNGYFFRFVKQSTE